MRMLPAAGVFAGVTAYTWQDVNFTVIGYVWIIIWYTFAVFEMVYVKKVVDTVKMTTWSRTYYQVKRTASGLHVSGPLPQSPVFVPHPTCMIGLWALLVAK